jgi:hypothetical protein
MVLIGLLLIAVAVAAAIILIVQNDGTIVLHVFNSDYDVKAYWLAIAGLAIMAVLALGLWALRVGTAHRVRRRRERRELLRENRRLSEQAAATPDPATSAPLRRGTTDQAAAGGATATEPGRFRADDPGPMPPARS